MNPFENDAARFLVLTNSEDQHSLWPANIAVPDGWSIAYGEASRADCLAYIESSWTDMRPKSLQALDY